MVISRLCKVAQIDGDVKLASRATFRDYFLSCRQGYTRWRRQGRSAI